MVCSVLWIHRQSPVASALLVFQSYLLSQTKFWDDFSLFNIFWFYVTLYSRYHESGLLVLIHNTQDILKLKFFVLSDFLLLIYSYSSCLFYWFGFLVLDLRILNICKYLLWALSVLLNYFCHLVTHNLPRQVCGIFVGKCCIAIIFYPAERSGLCWMCLLRVCCKHKFCLKCRDSFFSCLPCSVGGTCSYPVRNTGQGFVKLD